MDSDITLTNNKFLKIPKVVEISGLLDFARLNSVDFEISDLRHFSLKIDYFSEIKVIAGIFL